MDWNELLRADSALGKLCLWCLGPRTILEAVWGMERALEPFNPPQKPPYCSSLWYSSPSNFPERQNYLARSEAFLLHSLHGGFEWHTKVGHEARPAPLPLTATWKLWGKAKSSKGRLPAQCKASPLALNCHSEALSSARWGALPPCHLVCVTGGGVASTLGYNLVHLYGPCELHFPGSCPFLVISSDLQ